MLGTKSVTVASFQIFFLAYALIGLSFLASYTLIPGFQIEPFNSVVFVATWPLFLAGIASGNSVIYFTLLVLALIEVLSQTRIISVAWKSKGSLRILPMPSMLAKPFLGLAVSHVFLFSIWLSVGASKLSISPWLFFQSSIPLTPIILFTIFQAIKRTVYRKQRIS